jgi:mannose-6-phosphate isomerase
MNRLDVPLRFEPFLRPSVWGGHALAARLGKSASSEPIGESWEVSDHALHRSVVAAGPFRGQNLRTLMERHAADVLGHAAGKHATFPWLVKFLDCCDRLSVQVHPDAVAVRQLRPGEGSKTEAWFVLHAEPGARIWAGLKPGVGPKEFRHALGEKAVADLLHTFGPKVGDCVFLPSGTVHAVGGGVLLAEIQETSDVTFRLYDWDRVDRHGRSRELHVEESFASIHWDAGPVEPVAVGDWTRPATREVPLVRCGSFTLDFRQASHPITIHGGRLQTLIVVGGEATWDDGERVQAGEAWVLPAAMARRELRPAGDVALLLASLP